MSTLQWNAKKKTDWLDASVGEQILQLGYAKVGHTDGFGEADINERLHGLPSFLDGDRGRIKVRRQTLFLRPRVP